MFQFEKLSKCKTSMTKKEVVDVCKYYDEVVQG